LLRAFQERIGEIGFIFHFDYGYMLAIMLAFFRFISSPLQCINQLIRPVDMQFRPYTSLPGGLGGGKSEF
jgi:hypothetical protein